MFLNFSCLLPLYLFVAEYLLFCCGTNKVKYTIKISIIQAKCNNRQQQKIRINTWLIRILLLLFISNYFTSSNIKYIDNQLVTVIKIQMICKCKYKTI